MKKLLSIILFALLCCYAMAYDFSAVCSTGQTLYYNITSDVEPYTVEVTSENADGFYTTYPTGDLEIPETVEYNSITYSVTRIGDKAFNGCGELTSVSIPNSVTSIGEYAFEDCTELTSVTIPNSVTSIDSYAFLYCNGLETIIIGSGVTNIGTDAFAGCSILTSISVEESNSTFDSRDNCNAIIQTETNILVLGCKNTTIPNSVTSIGEDAFYGSDLESITIPNSVTTIANGAFSNCKNLTEITIPESVTSIGIYRYVFSECVALESIIVDANNTTYDSRDNCNAIIETETNTLIAGCKGTIIPNSVENISHAAFMGSGLRKVYIPNSVTNIANEVFYGCRSLTSVTIGSSVTEIGELAFYDCVNITEINLSTTTPPALGENVFTETIYNSATVWVPRGSGGIYMNTEFWTQFSTIREVPYYWLCNFEDEETWTLGNDQQDGNVQWQILTRETYPSSLYTSDNDAYIRPFVFYGDTLNNTPGHWAMADLISQVASFGGPGQVAESPWIEFSNINLIEAEQPQITFRQIFRQLNGVETSIRVSIDGGQTWTDHIVNEEVESNTYGEYEIRTGIREAAGEGNVKIRFLINSDAHAVQMGYGWEIDDIEIKEAPDTIIATAGEGGTISPNGEVLVDIGESVTFTITPNDGYRIASVMVDETENVTDQLVDGTYTFVDVIENHTIAATFEEIHTYTIIVLSNNDAYGFVSDGGTFEEGAVFMIEAMPNDGYRFVSWNDGNAENPRTITVTSDSTFVANFIRDGNYPQIVDFEELPLDGENSSWIGDDGSGQFTSSYLTLYNDYDSQYDTWTGFSYTNGTDTETNNYTNLSSCVGHGAGNSANYVTAYIGSDWVGDYSPIPVGMKIDTEHSGNFTNRGAYFCMPVYLKKYVVGTTSEHYYASHQLYFKLKASAYTTGALVGDREIMMADYTEGNSYMMDDWTYVDLSWIENADSLSFTAISNDTADGYGINTPLFFCMDNFGADAPVFYTIVATAGENGTITPNGELSIGEGRSQTFTILANEHYRIASVMVDDVDITDAVVAAEGVYSFENVTANHTIAATFEEIPTYTITVLSNNEAYGSVSGGGTYDEGSEITLSAMPNQGYLFDSWEDGNFDNPRSIEVTSDSTFIADFVKCEITQAIDTVVPNFVTVGEHTFYSTGNYSFSVLSENDCDTIFDIRLRVLAEPVYDIGPNPTKSLLNINSDGFISAVEFYSVTGQLVMRKEVNGYEAEFDMEGLVDGVYILRIYGEESSLPSVSKIIKE